MLFTMGRIFSCNHKALKNCAVFESRIQLLFISVFLFHVFEGLILSYRLPFMQLEFLVYTMLDSNMLWIFSWLWLITIVIRLIDINDRIIQGL